jgi:hypothetical protein
MLTCVIAWPRGQGKTDAGIRDHASHITSLKRRRRHLDRARLVGDPLLSISRSLLKYPRLTS